MFYVKSTSRWANYIKKGKGAKSTKSKEKTLFEALLKNYALEANLILTPEYRFSMQRQFKADWAVSNGAKTCLVEYEGISNYGKSGHTTLKGFTSNCEKYNLAQSLGYPVYRYTKLNFKQVLNDLTNFFTDNYDK